MANAYIVIRKAVLMEDEGRPHHLAVYLKRPAAEKWIAEQSGFFSPSDFWIAEVELKE